MAKKDTALEVKKEATPTQEYVLIRDFETSKGIKKAKSKIKASADGAKILKSQGYIN